MITFPRSALRRRSLQVLALAAAYGAGGLHSQLLAAGPGDTVPLWLPAGIALAALLLWGYRLWPGVWLGGFLISLYYADEPARPAALLLAGVDGSGAALQAVLGAWLARRAMASPTSLERLRDVGRLLFLVAPLSCLVSPTLGLTARWLAGAGDTAPPMSWAIWWFGDAMGVLIVTPLALAWSAQHDRMRWLVYVALPIGLVLVAVGALFFAVRAWEADRLRVEFERDANTLVQAVAEHFEGYLQVLHSFRGFFAGSQAIERQDFAIFARYQLAFRPEIQALTWNPRVTVEQRAAFESAVQRQGYPDFHITERGDEGRMISAGRRPEYFPVVYLEPYAGNEAAFGLDALANPLNRNALAQARDEARPVGTGRRHLVQDAADQFGWLVFTPIYANGLPAETAAARRRPLLGFVAGVFRLGDMVQAALAGLELKDIAVALYDVTPPGAAERLYADDATAAPQDLHWRRTLDMAGRRWQLRLGATPAYVAARQTWQAPIVLVGGLLVVGLLETLLLVVTGRTVRVEQVVAERTAALAQANVRLKREMEKAESASQAKSLFLSTMSHEIRTPLNAILGYAQIMEHDPGFPQSHRRALATIQKAGAHLLELINDVLDISKIEAGAMTVNPTDFDLGTLLGDLSELFRHRCAQKGLAWRVENAAGGSVPVHGDSGKLRQTLINFLGNAVKFTDRGEIVLRVSRTDGRYRFEVEDTGPGIAPHELSQLFEPFQQAEQGLRKGGTGLGLAIARRQIELLGGELTLESQPGRGTRVAFSLALAPAAGPIAPRPAFSSRRLRLAPDCRIAALVVDDVADNRAILTRMLENAGIEVRQAADGVEALAVVHERRPDIVFMDVRMPVMDGMETLRRLRAEPDRERMVLVAVTASAFDPQRQSYLEAGFDDLIAKPFDFDSVYQCIERHLEVSFEAASSARVAAVPAPDLAAVTLPEALHRRLRDAAELNAITELDALLAELRTLPGAAALAEHLAGLLAQYDTDAILTVLETIRHE